MGIKTKDAASSFVSHLKNLAANTKKTIGPVISGNQKYNPLCEYVLKTEGPGSIYITSVNTRSTARNIKREFEKDKGMKVKIIQYLYTRDRFKGGFITSARRVR